MLFSCLHLYSLMTALISDELQNCTHATIQMTVAPCLSKIFRITALDNPYSDKTLKDIFQLIVSSFLSDHSSILYPKGAGIV